MISEDERLLPEVREAAAANGYRSLIAVPVDAPRDAGRGLVLIFFADERSFSDDDLELARHLADATRGALERSELFEAERGARALAQQLTRTGRLLTSELDPAAVLDEVVQQAPALVNADAAAFRLLQGEELVATAAEGSGAEDALGSRSPAGGRLSGDVVQSGAPVAFEDAGKDERLRSLDPMLAAGHAAFLGVPVAGPEGAIVGVLAVYASVPREWREEEVEALLAVAASTSAALSNAELYQRVALERERSVAILANIADGIVAVDRDGGVVLWNSAAERITGVPAPVALGRTPADVLQRSLEAPAEAARGDRLVPIMRGREEVWLSVTEAVMRDPLGAVAGRIFAFRDISGDRLVEQVKSDFVSTVSHELRTPLTSIYGFAETLLRQDVMFGEEERQTFLRYIASESQRLTSIVDTLLNVARLDTGDLQVNIAETDVRDVVGRVLETVVEAERNGHRFVVELPDEPLAAKADPEKLRQVFAILVDNALRYSPDGGAVTVGVARRQDLVEVSIADEGIGIPQADQEQVFRKFYRGADAELRAGAGGTGLGLFIARGLVTAMGGRIWVSSREGEGSRFAFELPAAVAASGTGAERE
jgi:PAS domain S-box-containing protein